jgi:hypothetical protein
MEADPESLLPTSADDAVAMDLIHEMRDMTMLQEAQLPSSFISSSGKETQRSSAVGMNCQHPS